MKWEKLSPNLSFTFENEMGNLHKSWSHFKLNMVNKIFHFLKFQEFINELGKICFPVGKNEILNPLEILWIAQNF